MNDLHAALMALQELDGEIDRAEAALAEFGPRLEQLDAPVSVVEREIDMLRTKVEELRAQVQKVEANAEQKRERMKAYQERLSKVSSTKQNTALRAELDLVRKALDADLTDVKQLSEQATRTDLKLDDLRRQADRIRAEIGPQRDELLFAKLEAEEQLAVLRERRENQAVRLDQKSRRLYERLRSGRTRTVLAPLTAEGACGNCFNMLPVQEQAIVRQAAALHRCEACGVILYAA
jgi:predicted  nucleic acid-binding Zn-ribbon protein